MPGRDSTLTVAMVNEDNSVTQLLNNPTSTVYTSIHPSVFLTHGNRYIRTCCRKVRRRGWPVHVHYW